MLRKGFLLPKAKEQAEEVDIGKCKHCKREFTRLTTHLNQKLECKAAYTEDEITDISKKLTSDRKRRYNDDNREKINKNQNQYDKLHREEKNQKQALRDKDNRVEKNQKQAQRDKDHREEKNQKQAQRDKDHREYKKANWTAEDRINAFHESTKWGWSFVCSSCHRKFFQHQVLDLKPLDQNHLKDMMKISSLKQVCNHSQLWKHEGKCKHICRTCYPYLNKYIKDLEPCLQNGTCKRPTIWWADGLKDPSKEEDNKKTITEDNVGEEWEPPLDFLMESWVNGWDEEILCLQNTVKTMLDHDLTQQDIISDCLPDCSEEGMCGICMFDRVYYCVSMEHGTTDCTTLVTKSTRTSRLENVIKFIDLMKKNNHHLTD